MPELLDRISAHLETGDLIGGEEVSRFESELAELHDAEYAVAVNSGTDALRLTIRALGLPPGAVGITVANTFIATVGAMISEGVRPLLVDVGTDENIDVNELQRALTRKPAVVVAVHLRGRPCDLREIRDLCERTNTVLIEDCAQAVLASYGGQRVGTFGIAGCFSLNPLKNLGACGDAGVIVTNDAGLASELRLLRGHGLADRNTAVRWGVNSRLDTLQASALNVKLPHLADWTARRGHLATIYDERLVGLPLTLPARTPDREHVFHRYCIRSPRRDGLQRHLQHAGIATAVHYPTPIHKQPASLTGELEVPAGGLPVTEIQSNEILSLPLHPELSDRQIGLVGEEISRFLESGAK